MTIDTSVEIDLNHLDEHGYTLVPDFLPRDQTARMRQHMDDLLPPPAPPAKEGVNRVNTLRHPIPGDIMAEFAVNPRLIDAATQILRTQADDLSMLEQVLIRTDPIDPAQLPPDRKLGWHVDQAFFPRSYDAHPRQTYFHMVHLLADMKPGQAAFHIVPRSHKLTYAATSKLDTEEQLDEFKGHAIDRAGIDLNDMKEVTGKEGDLLIFNPMCLHAGSPNRTDQPRYVYFASFMDKSARELADRIRRIKYLGEGYEQAFRNRLPENRRHLIDWYLQSA